MVALSERIDSRNRQRLDYYPLPGTVSVFRRRPLAALARTAPASGG